MNREYDNSNRGVLFPNAEKEQDNHADYQGNINVGGQEFWLNGWKKKSKAGKSYLSLSVKPKQARQGSNPTSKQNADAGFGDDEPF
jgi:uncharacterized protein (DUF736 family)